MMLLSLPECLLAKSKKGNKVVTLEKHCLDTKECAKQIFDLSKRWGKNWCRFFKIYDEKLQHQFLINLYVATLFHDIGKANEDFYNAVTKVSQLQTLRHEHISALILSLKEVRSWLAKNVDLDVDVITAAVLSHHIKASSRGDWCWGSPKNAQKVRFFLNHREVTSILEKVCSIAKLDKIPQLPSWHWSQTSNWVKVLTEGHNNAKQFSRKRLQNNVSLLSLLIATKAALIVSDSVSSGLVREGYNIESWITETVHTKPLTAEEIETQIIIKRIEQLSKDSKFAYHNFQIKAAETGSRALLLAPCGSGKTLAAWKWAQSQAKKYDVGRVIFLYPTRATSTEGFRDYVSWAPEGDASLLHSTARYELEAMQENPESIEAGKHISSESQERLFALGLWSKRYFSATVDQFLSFMEHSYSALCLLPVLADSILIIDEIHSFDRKMFDTLISFLSNFDLPVLCMTATLPPSRKEELVNIGFRVYPTDAEKSDLPDLINQETVLRYKLENISENHSLFSKAIEAYKKGQRVLWIVNTVDRCQNIARKIAKQISENVLVYHSRYRLCDRQNIHTKTVKAFQQINFPVIAVTTQVCEMSLDLDADVLITEIAPIASLIQRFGRANRKLSRGRDFQAKLYTYSPESSLPYKVEELEAANKFLQELTGKAISQQNMVEIFEKYALQERTADGSARFLESGYFAIPGTLRNIDEMSVPAILDQDIQTVEDLINNKKPYDGYIINIPTRYAIWSERPAFIPKYLALANGASYDFNYGFVKE